MSLKNLYEDLVNHLENARDAKNHEQYKRVRGMMLEIKSYARLLEADLSRLNQSTAAKRRGGEHLEGRQTIQRAYAQVLMEKRHHRRNRNQTCPR